VVDFFIKESGYTPEDIITYPWQLLEYFKGNNHINDNDMSENNVDNVQTELSLLRYKKQIILQGPPGTGKTKLAKELAIHLIKSDFDEEDLKLINLGETLQTKTDRLSFVIKDISTQQKYFKIKPDSAKNEYTINFKQILDCLQQRGWDDLTEKWNSHGNASYLLAIAKEIAKRKDSQICHNQLKLLQFHPSYTYEDFVRGIVSKPNENGDGILYE